MTNEDFIGFSTVDQKFGLFTLTNIDLVKRDLLNAFQTRRGERVMRPNFGTIIFDVLLDPFDDQTKNLIIEDAQRIVGLDPRVELVSIDAQELDKIFRVDIELRFLPSQRVERLFVDFDRRNIQDT